MLCYASAIHKHTRTHILKPFEDSELMELKVDIAKMLPIDINDSWCDGVLRHLCWFYFILELGVRIIVHSWSIYPDVIIIWSWSLGFYEHIDTIWNWSGVEWTDRIFSCADIMNRKARLAWELYLKMETSGESFSLLQLIANDCYKVQWLLCACFLFVCWGCSHFIVFILHFSPGLLYGPVIFALLWSKDDCKLLVIWGF